MTAKGRQPTEALGPIPPRRWSAMSRQLTYARASDEHGRLTVSAATNRLGLSDKIRLIPGHYDPNRQPLQPGMIVRAAATADQSCQDQSGSGLSSM